MKFIARIWLKTLQEWWQITVPVRLRSIGVQLGSGVRFYGMPIVSLANSSAVTIGDRAVLASHSGFTALGVSRPCILRTTRPGARIQIGPDTGMSGSIICSAISITIGRQCLIGADVLIADNDFHPVKPEARRYSALAENIGAAPVVIEDNVFIGTRSIILKGVRIGRDSVIGAGSVVVSDIPAGVVAAGNPARVVKGVM